jgi:hypothetical protein
VSNLARQLNLIVIILALFALALPALAQLTVTEYQLPSGLSTLGSITSGPDGALWFTDTNFGGRPNGDPDRPGEHHAWSKRGPVVLEDGVVGVVAATSVARLNGLWFHEP